MWYVRRQHIIIPYFSGVGVVRFLLPVLMPLMPRYNTKRNVQPKCYCTVPDFIPPYFCVLSFAVKLLFSTVGCLRYSIPFQFTNNHYNRQLTFTPSQIKSKGQISFTLSQIMSKETANLFQSTLFVYRLTTAVFSFCLQAIIFQRRQH